MRKISRILLVSFSLMLLSVAAFAQNTITGKVTDSKDGSPLAGVTVTVKGATTATQTGADGSYKISAPANATLVFTSIGFGRLEIPSAGLASVDAKLVQSNQQMNEVVVVAYGTRRRGDLTGSVTSVSSKDFQKGNIASPEQLLLGKVAGLQITSGGGSPGGGSRLRIRNTSSLNASNDPLIVIDGVPVEGNSINGGGNLLNTINPNDIESMSVLKDASATALYGSRATNGVLIITTKKGTRGKIKFNFNTNISMGMVGKTVDVFTGDEIRNIVNAEAVKSGNNGYKNLLGTANTDWQDKIYQSALGFDNNLSASGALLKVLPFRLSAGYTSQEGILLTDKFDRITAALNLSPKFLNDHLSVNLNFKYANTKYRHADGGAVGAAASFDPTQEVNSTNKYGGYFEWLDANGKPQGTNGNASNPNPLSLLKFRNNKETINRMIGNIQLDYKLHWLPDLHILANVGMDNTTQDGNDNIDSLLVTNQSTAGRYVHYKQKKSNNLYELSLSYSKEFKSIKSKLELLAGHGYQEFQTDVYNFAAYSQAGKLIAGTTPEFATDRQQNRIESYFGRLNFAYDNKYLVTASLRRDASSRFSKANRVGYFPSVALAWKLKDDFFRNSSEVSDLKLRLGWGVTGQQDGIGNYAYQAIYSQSNSTAQYQFGNNFYYFYRPTRYYPDLKWETTTTQNIGLDFGFLNNRITGSVDFYNKKTKDLLSVVGQAPGQNFDIDLLRNIGNMENNGIEITINTTPVKKSDLIWDFGFNLTFQNSKITKLANIVDPNFTGNPVSGISGGTGNFIGVHQVGYAPFIYYARQQVYDAKTGLPIEGLYEDRNRDGVPDDQYYYSKNPAPTMMFGINTQVAYKNWSLGLAAHGSYNNYLYNNYASRTGVLNAIQNGALLTNGSRDYLNTGFRNQQYLSDYYLQNASFLRLDNINIGYNFGKIIRNKASLRLSGSVQNVFVITKYKGLDPENSSSSGVDNNIYPRPRVFTIGANLDF
ncbi:MAG: SusC/RagA family TonB-linked outer membrane protein [Chitinophagaceae bacterium]|nr:SusC/RagA family TonB-linked outer membrane protein [Chitinophagaceae bacterium]MBL0057397.1 SusC/RagA family TonB-linked outer membrane protein [Chitinophagaceae bacterium]